jgi:hypothetical protein
MSAETELLTMKLSAYEVFMEVIAAKLHCLPSYADPLPTKGNSHIVAKLDALLNSESPATPSNTASPKLPPEIDCVASLKRLYHDKISVHEMGVIGDVYNFIEGMQ